MRAGLLRAANFKLRHYRLFGLYPFLLKLYADGGYQGPKFQQGLARVSEVPSFSTKHDAASQEFLDLQ